MDPASTAGTSPDLALVLRLLLQAAALVGLGQAAWWRSASARFVADRAERLLVAVVLFLLIVTLLPTILGLLGLFTAPAFGIGCAVIWVGAFVRARPTSLRWESPDTNAEALPRSLRLAGAIALAFYVPSLLRSIFEVPVRWDSLTYHLFLPATWIVEARVFNPDMPYPLAWVAHYPKHHELFVASTMVVARNDLFVEIATLLLYLTSGLAVRCLCARLGASNAAAFAAGVFVVTIPAHLNPSSGAYAEGLLVTVMMAALVFALASMEAMRSRAEASVRMEAILACGLAIGLAAGTKYTALGLGVLLVVVLAVDAWRSDLRGAVLARTLGAFGVVAGISGGVWYALNVASHGNPFHPVPFGPFEGAHRFGLPWEGASILDRVGPLLRSGELLDVWLSRPDDRPWLPTLGWKSVPAIGLAAIGVFVLLRARVAGALGVSLAFAVLVVGYLRLPYWQPGWLVTQTRFAVPALCVGAALGFAALSRVGVPPRVLGVLVLIGLALDAPMLDLTLPDLAIGGASTGAAPGGETPGVVVAGRDVGTRLLAGRFVVASIVGVAVIWVGRSAAWPGPACMRRRRTIALVAAAPIVLALIVAPWVREANRYEQLQWGGAPGPKARFVPAAAWLEAHHPGRPVAAVGSYSLEFLYLFSGRHIDRSVADGRQAGRDEASWGRALASDGRELLLCMTWPTRAEPLEAEAARRAGWSELYRDASVSIFEIAPIEADDPPS